MSGAQVNGICRLAENADELRGEQIAQKSDDFRGNAAAKDAEGNAFLGAFILLCAQILADEGGKCLGTTGTWAGLPEAPVSFLPC